MLLLEPAIDIICLILPFFPSIYHQGSLMFADTGCSKEKKWANLKFVASVNLHQKAFIFSSLAVYSLSLFISSLSLCVFCSLTLLLYPHTQTETNTAVTVAYYSGQVRACRWGPLNAGATAHQCLRSRGTCCDHRWWLAIYTHIYTQTYSQTCRLPNMWHTMNANRNISLCHSYTQKVTGL